jgi:hypothetical protein
MEAETVARSSGKREVSVRHPSKQRSRVTNGTSLFVEGDGNSAWARRLRDLCSEHVADLGGAEACSVAERLLVRRAAALTCELERLEGKFATDGAAADSDLDLYSRVSNTLRRHLESVGLSRRARDVSTNLRSYLSGRPSTAAASPQGNGADGQSFLSGAGPSVVADESSASEPTAGRGVRRQPNR